MRSRQAVTGTRAALASLGEMWCRTVHNDLGWPVGGHYRCRRCNRVYEIPWEDSATPSPERPEPGPAKPASIAA